MTGYDHIIVGAGSAGAILAARLSEEADVRVLLIEAGGSDRDWRIAMPAALAYHSDGGRLRDAAARRRNVGAMVGNLVQSMFGRANNWPLGAAISVAAMVAVTAAACLFLQVTSRYGNTKGARP